jgi:hypothetical protein
MLPVMFTGCEPVTSVFSNAATDGIEIVGRDQLVEPLKLVERRLRRPKFPRKGI